MNDELFYVSFREANCNYFSSILLIYVRRKEIARAPAVLRERSAALASKRGKK